MRTAVLFTIALLLIVPAAARSKKKYSLKKLARNFNKAVKYKKMDTAVEIIGMIGDHDNVDAVKLLLGIGFSQGDPDVFQASKKALVRIDDKKAMDFMVELLTKKEEDPNGKKKKRKKKKIKLPPYEVKCILAEVFGEKGSDRAIVALCKALEDANEVVLRTAIKALHDRKKKEVVAALIGVVERFDGEKGLPWVMARDELTHLTGEDFPDAQGWRGFWQVRGDKFDFKKDKGKKKGATVVRKQKFFGTEIRSSRIIFVIDTSGSMKLTDPEPGEDFDFEKPVPDGQLDLERERMKRAREELSRVVKGLPKETKFNIMGFSSGVHKWKQELVPADARNKEDAVLFASKLRPVGATLTDYALEEAFKFQDVDTIYFLSDGAPFKTGNRDRDILLCDEILLKVNRWNRFRKVAIHTLGFDGPGIWPVSEGKREKHWKEDAERFKKFMEDLAKQNKGTYKSIE
jgi:hypothetical protein